MSRYRIVAARPKGASNHCNAQFKIYQWGKKAEKVQWWEIGWKSINQVSDYLSAGHEVRTGRYEAGVMKDSAPVELELRITRNGTDFRISDILDS